MNATGEAGESSAGTIFISYRRSDANNAATAVRQNLLAHFGEVAVFQDVTGIPAGARFPDELRTQLAQARAVVVLMGPGWLAALDEYHRRRIDDPADWVHIEIATALADDDTLVVPVLLDSATMPPAEAFPQPLAGLAEINAVRVRASDWDADIEALLDAVAEVVPPRQVHREGKPRSKEQRAFISYARSDGQPFAIQLERDLPDDIGAWLDRQRMSGDDRWWQQIKDAIDAAQYLVAVMTPGAITSEMTRREWQYARRRGVRICPVKGVPDAELDYDALPQWMRGRHFYDPEHERERLVSYLREDYDEPKRVPFTAPDLPRQFVQRPDEFGQLKAMVLDRERHDPVPITTALAGSGGFGKTTLAIALCHDDDVFTAFEDGILWVELGEKPDLLAKLTELYASLTGRRPGFTTVQDAANTVADRLTDDRCLLVIDDVWDRDHAEPFLLRADHCTKIVTTRDPGIARALGSDGTEPVAIDEMTADEATDLLVARVPEADGTARAAARALARQLGEWPLLLNLAGALIDERVAEGESVVDAIGFAAEAYGDEGLRAFDERDSEARDAAAARSMAVSERRLNEENRERFRRLGITPEDTDIPFRVLEQLWGARPVSADRTVKHLVSLGLIRRDLRAKTIRLHDVIRTELERRLRDEAAALHGELLEAIGGITGLDTEYGWRWWAHHMVAAGRADELSGSMLTYHWLEQKLVHTDPQSILADLSLLALPAASTLASAVRLSAGALTENPDELAAQLVGRLDLGNDPILDAITEAAERRNGPCIHPRSPCLTPPGGPLVMSLRGHAGTVRAVALSPDGHHTVTGADDDTVRVWDLRTGQQTQQLNGHTDSVRAVAVTPTAATPSPDHPTTPSASGTSAQDDKPNNSTATPTASAPSQSPPTAATPSPDHPTTPSASGTSAQDDKPNNSTATPTASSQLPQPLTALKSSVVRTTKAYASGAWKPVNGSHNLMATRVECGLPSLPLTATAPSPAHTIRLSAFGISQPRDEPRDPTATPTGSEPSPSRTMANAPYRALMTAQSASGA
ncbi:MAG: TIR domain-containing protein [Actinomycetota bacterium]|nr:TIR domain-containing protein [Actinomycetota bacterium]